MSSRIRLSDVAQHAQVSTATVSRVLNGKPDVSEKTRHAVLAALDMLGYERPEAMRARAGGLIGLIVPELSNPIFTLYAEEIERLLVGRGYMPLLCTQSPGGITEDEYVRILLERNVDGIIFISGLHADTAADPLRYHQLADTPHVLINGANPQINAPSFDCDDRYAVAQAVTHLVSLGHSRIGLVTGPQRFVPTQAKVDGFRTAMATALPHETPLIATSLFTIEGGQAATANLIGKGCTGIIAASDLMALGAIRQSRAMGLRVPEDVSIVGFDDSPLMAFTDPPLTTVRQPVSRISQAAVSTLIQLISGSEAETSSLTFAPELLVRSSTAPVLEGKIRG